MSKQKVHVIPHTHWDREWYFTTSRSTIYLIKHIKEVLDTLETDSSYDYYLLDAQTSLVEEYLAYCPEDRARIENLVSQERLLTGPWVTQTDQLVVSQESVVRNLYYGTTEAESFGHCMRVGYVPDAFGQGGNMPQIYQNFAIKDVLFWRGLSDTRGKYTEINWQGDDGTQVFAVQIPQGYCTSGFMPEDYTAGKKYWDEQLTIIESRASTKHLYASWGFDQAPVRKNLPQLLADANQYDPEREYQLNSPENFFKELRQEVDFDHIKTIKGELTEGKHSRVHKSIFSTRADLKQLNNQVENYLVNVLEPILAMSYTFGHRYPHKEVEEIWKLLFENAAHDSIGGCNSDSTNEDIKQRYKLAKDKAENLLELNLRLITQRIEQKEPIFFTVFNPLTYSISKTVEFTAYVPSREFTLIDEQGQEVPFTISDSKDVTEYMKSQVTQLSLGEEMYVPDTIYQVVIKLKAEALPAFGYTSYQLVEKSTTNCIKETEQVASMIENETYKVSLEPNNSLTILCKKTGRVYENQMIFEENGDDGDSYNYSPPRRDLVVSSLEAECSDVKTICSEVEQKLKFTLIMQIPKDLESRAQKQKDGELTLNISVSLKTLSETIHFDVEADNQVLSHRLCVLFDTGIVSQLSTADQFFGVVQRPVDRQEMAIWEEEQWEETPIGIEPMQSYTSLHDQTGGCAVITEGIREYEIVGEKDSIIRLTLFRTFGFMGKADLLYRPGRASGDSIVATPDAQLLGPIKTTFDFYDFADKYFDQAQVGKIAKEVLTNLPVYESADFLNNRMRFVYRKEAQDLATQCSLLDFQSMDSVVSTIKKAEKSDELIIRIYNPYIEKDSTIAEQLSINGEAVMLDEQTIIEQTKNRLNKCQFTTFRLSI